MRRHNKPQSGRLRWITAGRLDDVARRALDIAVSGVALVCLAPLMAVIAIALFLEGGTPILFHQRRIGLNGRLFNLHKFRKFAAREGTGGSALTLRDDARLTRIGKVLERTKFDELPQFWNVLRGEMSLVGPRPESLRFEDCFRDAYRRLLEYRPGIFGPAQAAFRNESAMYRPNIAPERMYRDVLFPTKASLDLGYYPTRTVLRDVAWVGRGLWAIAGLSQTLPPTAVVEVGVCLSRPMDDERHGATAYRTPG